jgi:hypothetical protein
MVHYGGRHRDSRVTGRAGEYAVAAQLLLRDVIPYWPAVDEGCDMITSTGCRLQVKCGRLMNSDGRYGQHYMFQLRRRNLVRKADFTMKRIDLPTFSETCDFVIFWGIDQNRFWIVPPQICDDCAGSRLGMELTTRPRLVAKQADVQEMVSLGYSQEQIAQHYKITRSVVQRFLHEGRDWDESSISRMRACENDWDAIVKFSGRPYPLSGEPLAKESLSEGL